MSTAKKVIVKKAANSKTTTAKATAKPKSTSTKKETTKVVNSYENLIKNVETKSSNCKTVQDVEKGMELVQSYIAAPSEGVPNKQAHILLYWLGKKKEQLTGVKTNKPTKTVAAKAKKQEAKAVESKPVVKPAKKTTNNAKASTTQTSSVTVGGKQLVSAKFKNLTSGETILTLSKEPAANQHLEGEFKHHIGDEYVFVEELKAGFFKVIRLKDDKRFSLDKSNFIQK